MCARHHACAARASASEKRTVCAASQAPGNNKIKEIGDLKTFFEINVKGPPPGAAAGSTTSVDLTFKFVRRDDGSAVTIPWMQFTLFDFDQNNDGNTGNGLEARGRRTTPLRTAPARPTLTPGPWPVCAVHESQWICRLRALQQAGRGGR